MPEDKPTWNPEHLEIVKQGAEATKSWRDKRPIPFSPTEEWLKWKRDPEGLSLSGADLHEADLVGFDLSGAKLAGATLTGASLRHADLRWADLRNAHMEDVDATDAKLVGACLSGATLRGAILWLAQLTGTKLAGADLREAKLNTHLFKADLRGADLRSADLDGAELEEVSFTDAVLDGAEFRRVVVRSDITDARGLDKIVHQGPSSIVHELLLRPTKRAWPVQFLRGCGLTDAEIEFTRSIATTPIEFYSAFISYSSKDDKFAVKLHDALQAKGIRCWLDKHEILPGDNITRKVNEGIRLWDKVLLCCSANSLTPKTGWWVTDEIERALEKERQLQKERNDEVLSIVPLNMDGFLFDPTCANEHAPTLRKRHAPKFVGWETDEKLFDEQLARVVKALRADDLARPKPPKSKL